MGGLVFAPARATAWACIAGTADESRRHANGSSDVIDSVVGLLGLDAQGYR